MTEYERQYHKWFKAFPRRNRRSFGRRVWTSLSTTTTRPTLQATAILRLQHWARTSTTNSLTNSRHSTKPTLTSRRKHTARFCSVGFFSGFNATKPKRLTPSIATRFFFALGLDGLLVHKTQSALARHYCVERATVSARVKAWQKTVGLKPSAFMKSESACNSYSAARMKFLTRRQ